MNTVMKKKILMGVLLALPVLAVIWLPGCGQRNAQDNTPTTGNPPANQPVPGETASNAPAVPPPTPPAPEMPTNSPGTNAPATPPAANQ